MLYEVITLLISHKAHIHHVVSIAASTSLVEEFEVDILTSTKENFKIIKSLIDLFPNNRCKLQLIKPTRLYTITRMYKRKLYPTYSNVIRNNYID